jgi:hypothetical protein
MLTSYDGAKGTSSSKRNGNGRWERKIVSEACVINLLLLMDISYISKKEKSLEMLAITTGFISYIQIKKVNG